MALHTSICATRNLQDELLCLCVFETLCTRIDRAVCLKSGRFAIPGVYLSFQQYVDARERSYNF